MAKQELSDVGSPVSGFGVSDFDLKCPNDASKVCPARLMLVRQYVGDLGINDTDGSIPPSIFSDRKVLTVKLGEHTFNAIRLNTDSKPPICDDATDTFCPPRKAMNESPVRKAGVTTARNIMKIFGIRGH